MKFTKKTIISFALVTLIVLLITSCGAKTASYTSKITMNEGLPIVNEPVKLKMFIVNNLNNKLKTYGVAECFKEITKRTGVEIEWQHPTTGNETDQFNLMIASREFPDIIFWEWNNLNGGRTRAIEDKILIRLNELMDNYAPNYKKLLDADPDFKKKASLGDGTIPLFLILEENNTAAPTDGLQIRRDWLNKLGLPVPTTIDEWYTALKAFKTKDPNGDGGKDIIPLGDMGGNTFARFETAWGLMGGFYLSPVDGKVHFGTVEPQYKDFVQTMRKWYSEGLIDPEFASVDMKNFRQKVITNKTGSYYGWLGSSMGFLMNQMLPKNPKVDIIGTQAPIGIAGKPYTPSVLCNVTSGAGITTTSKYPEIAARFLDYCYSEEGSNLIVWGTEGKSYTNVNGKRQFTDEILKNPNGDSPVDAAAKYCTPIQGFTRVTSREAYKQINLKLPQQVETTDIWLKSDRSLVLPKYDITPEKNAELVNILNEVNTYRREMLFKFIMGEEPMQNYDKFVQTINDMGIDKAIKIQQEAYDLFKNK